MLTLRAGAAAIAFLPPQGAACVALTQAGRDLLVPMPPGADPNRGFHGAFLMAPWTNRLDGGRIAVGGVAHGMPVNRPAENNALHGFLREMAWTVESQAPDAATLACRFDRPPFAGIARLAVRLAPDRCTLALSLTNGGATPTPMGFGWHPYFPRPIGTHLSARTRIAFGRDARNLPVDPAPHPGPDGAEAALEGLDTHFAGWDGAARIAWPDGTGLTMTAEGAWSRNLQVYAPPGHGALAVEPVSHAPDAANRPDSAAHGPMHLLAPGATLEGRLTLAWA